MTKVAAIHLEHMSREKCHNLDIFRICKKSDVRNATLTKMASKCCSNHYLLQSFYLI